MSEFMATLGPNKKHMFSLKPIETKPKRLPCAVQASVNHNQLILSIEGPNFHDCAEIGKNEVYEELKKNLCDTKPSYSYDIISYWLSLSTSQLSQNI